MHNITMITDKPAEICRINPLGLSVRFERPADLVQAY